MVFKNKRFSPSHALIAAILLASVLTMLRTGAWRQKDRVINWDVACYYHYLPAAFIYNDLSMKFMQNYQGSHYFLFYPQYLPNGKAISKVSMGVAIMYAPFFFVGHAWAHAGGYDTGGFSEPYIIMLILSGLFFFILGLLVLRRVLLHYFTEGITTLTLAAVGIGTNLFWYGTVDAAMSHAFSFFWITVFLWYTLRWYDKATVRSTIGLAVAFGMITLIRPVNLLLLPVFLLWGIHKTADLVPRFRLFMKHYPLMLLMVLCGLLVWTPQLIYWKSIAGQWFCYTYADESFYFDNPHVFNGLFGFRKGFFTYTPVMLFALTGMWKLKKHVADALVPLLIFLPVFVYVIFSWWAWWYGGSFGLRAMIDIYALLALPLASQLAAVSVCKRYLKWTAYTLLFAAIAVNILFMKRFQTGSLHYIGMTRKLYFSTFFDIKPKDNFWNELEEPRHCTYHGIDETQFERALQFIASHYVEPQVVKTIRCNAEESLPDRAALTSGDSLNFLFSGYELLTTEKSASGSHSLRTDSAHREAFACVWAPPLPSCTLRVSVLCISSGHTVNLAVNSADGSFRQESSVQRPADIKDWNRISMEILIPEKTCGDTLKISVFQTEDQPAWFDDLSISFVK